MDDTRSDREILIELEKTVSAINSAFIKDEIGAPDYASHRIFHRSEANLEEDKRKKKIKIISDVTTWAVIGLITIVLSQILSLIPQIGNLMGK